MSKEAILQIAAIAHFGGLADMSEEEALRAIRCLTLRTFSDNLASKSPEEIKALIRDGKDE